MKASGRYASKAGEASMVHEGAKQSMPPHGSFCNAGRHLTLVNALLYIFGCLSRRADMCAACLCSFN